MPNCAIYVCMHSIFAYEIPVNFLDHYKKQIQKEYPNSFINNLKPMVNIFIISRVRSIPIKAS